jgi:hypothetical protein
MQIAKGIADFPFQYGHIFTLIIGGECAESINVPTEAMQAELPRIG